MAFLQRPRSLQPFYEVEDSELVNGIPSYTAGAVENVPQKRKRTQTSSNHIISRVSTIFSSRRKGATPPDLDIVNSTLQHTVPRRSFSSFCETIESEDDIRIPSGLGSAATIYSFPIPPSPSYPLRAVNGSSPLSQIYMNGDFPRSRALSSPNLLRSMSVTLGRKTLSRRTSSMSLASEYMQPMSSIPANDTTPRSSVIHSPAKPATPPRRETLLPQEIIITILSHLPTHTVTTCATVSRDFATAVRILLYTTLDFEMLSPIQAEKLVTLLVSRRKLTDLVTSLICRKWPTFFIPDTGRDTIVVTHPNATLLTAAFTLAFERMSNLVMLVLPAFDASLLRRHSAFGLKSLTFLHHTMACSETNTLFSWLNGQINITTLQFPNLDDAPVAKSPAALAPDPRSYNDDNRLSQTKAPLLHPSPTSYQLRRPSTSPAGSPKPSLFSQVAPPSISITLLDATFSSPTLLPNLTTLQAPPWLVMRLAAPVSPTSPRKPLCSISLNINTTLYNGLRPAALMNMLHGVKHLSVRFSEAVDKRSFEKVLGAAGASLGRPTPKSDNEAYSGADISKWAGLESLEIIFDTVAAGHSGRDEALYKSIQASLPRYNALAYLRLRVLADDSRLSEYQTHSRTPSAYLSAPEQVLLDSWAKLCPTLHSVTLFSGAQWYNKRTRFSLRLPEERMNRFKFPSVN